MSKSGLVFLTFLYIKTGAITLYCKITILIIKLSAEILSNIGI